jgi:hypothetical protein
MPDLEKFVCENCGPLDFAHMDGYGFGDTILEGVTFEVRISEGTTRVNVAAKDAKYFKTLNERLWLEHALDYAKGTDNLICPTCGRDIDNA